MIFISSPSGIGPGAGDGIMTGMEGKRYHGTSRRPEHPPLPLGHEVPHFRRGAVVAPAAHLDDFPAPHFYRVERLADVHALAQEQDDALMLRHAVRIGAHAVVQGVPLWCDGERTTFDARTARAFGVWQ